jgi:hypothetical protein
MTSTTTTRRIVTIHDCLQRTGTGRVDGTWIWQRGESVYRTSYHADNHADQSFMSTELWTPAGWTPVIRQNGFEIELPNPYDKDLQRDVIRDLLHAQQDLATRIVLGA